ncbi:MAG: diaminopimelate epimerase [Lentisphaeria bacterium]|nr:diaminopimelate epimerase [Lentisphaeria bacterium]
MVFEFTKMHGAGNDFILARMPSLSPEKREKVFSRERIAFLCDRHLGIGGDGLILAEPLATRSAKGAAMAEMHYFNSDGGSAAMCGNGLRCAASFLYRKGLLGKEKEMCFLSAGIEAESEILDEEGKRVKIHLDVTEGFRKFEVTFEGRTFPVYKGGVGVPHAVAVLKEEEWNTLDVRKLGSFLRYHSLFAPEGANADFLFFPEGEREKKSPRVLIRTYERGVEDETLCCGTGCSSSAVVLRNFFSFPAEMRFFCRKGDEIAIEIPEEGNTLKRVHLSGPAETVFEGKMLLDETAN